MKTIHIIFCCAAIVLCAAACRQTVEDTPAMTTDTKVYAGFRLKSISITGVSTLATDADETPATTADMYVQLEKSGAAAPFQTSNVRTNIATLPFLYTFATPLELEQKTVYNVYVYDKDQPAATFDYFMGVVPFKLSDYNGKATFQNAYNGTSITITGEWY